MCAFQTSAVELFFSPNDVQITGKGRQGAVQLCTGQWFTTQSLKLSCGSLFLSILINVNAFIGNVAGFEGKGCKHKVIGSQPAAHEGGRVVVYVVDSVSHNFA